jgi:hypothetical protein
MQSDRVEADALVPCGPKDPIAYGETQQLVIPEDVQKQMRQHINCGRSTLPKF